MSDLSDLTQHPIDPERQADLRRRAAARLTGAAADKGAAGQAADALAVLHALAASPATAQDALTLLHELQVHQVELELQAQELRESRVELESALRRQIELYDHQPVGSFTIDARLVLHELNLTGAAMLGVGREQAGGLALDAFLSADGARLLRSAIAGLTDAQRPASCPITLSAMDGPAWPAIASIAADPASGRYLLNVTRTGA